MESLLEIGKRLYGFVYLGVGRELKELKKGSRSKKGAAAEILSTLELLLFCLHVPSHQPALLLSLVLCAHLCDK